jgi:hypothetical protein
MFQHFCVIKQFRANTLLGNTFFILQPLEIRFISIFIFYLFNYLNPGIVAACHWGDESGKLVYSSMFGHVPTCVYVSHRPNESFAKSSTGSSTSLWYTVGGKMSDKNLLQRIINIKFCVKISKSACETLALLTVAYGKHTLNK